MIKEAIDRLVDLGRRDGRSTIVPLPGEPGYVYGILKPDGEVLRAEATPRPGHFRLDSLGDLVHAAGLIGRDTSSEPAAMVALVGEKEITVATQRQARERAAVLVFPLQPTEQFQVLEKINDGDGDDDVSWPLSQGAFVDFLRVRLNGCVPADAIGLFRQLKKSEAREAEGTVQPGKESLRGEVRRVVYAQGKELPAELALAVSAYDETVTMVSKPVRVAVVANLEHLTFRLVPMAGELTRARMEAREWLAAELIALFTAAEFNVPVLLGSTL